jgi:hypothetical protein
VFPLLMAEKKPLQCFRLERGCEFLYGDDFRNERKTEPQTTIHGRPPW